jgi:hypothetical protein
LKNSTSIRTGDDHEDRSGRKLGQKERAAIERTQIERAQASVVALREHGARGARHPGEDHRDPERARRDRRVGGAAGRIQREDHHDQDQDR